MLNKPSTQRDPLRPADISSFLRTGNWHLAMMSRKALYLLCDLQEAFRHKIPQFSKLIKVHERMLRSCHALNIPVIVTEQNPKKLGNTVNELLPLLNSGTDTNSVSNTVAAKVYPKMGFSMLRLDSSPEDHLQEMNLMLDQADDIILSGIEAHVCILQTIIQLNEKFYQDSRALSAKKRIYVLMDGIASRHPFEVDIVKDRLKHAEFSEFVRMTSSESWLFQYLQTADHPAFKSISQIVKDTQHD